MVRRARMNGHATLWLPGVDHASIAAQVVLDRILAAEGESRASLGRERYLERMWQFMDATRDVITEQHRRLGASADWSRQRFTMDAGSAQRGARRRSSACTTTASPIATSSSSTGAPAAGPACRTWR